MTNFCFFSPHLYTRAQRIKTSALRLNDTKNARTMPSNTTPPPQSLPFNFVENLISEIRRDEKPDVQAKALIALAALSLRVQLDPESFLRVVEPILDVLERKNNDDTKNDDDFEGVKAAALAALSCFLGNVDRAHAEMLRNERRGLKIVLKAIERAMEENERVKIVNGIDCLVWTCRDKQCASSVLVGDDGKRVVEEARKMCEVEYVEGRYFPGEKKSGDDSDDDTNTNSNNSNNNSEETAKEKDKSTSSDNNGSKNNGKEEAKRVHYRRQEDAVAPKQIVAGAFELFVALSVLEAEKITMEHGGLEVFASAIKRVGGGDEGVDIFTKNEEAKYLEHFKNGGSLNPAEDLERLKQDEINETASRALVGISCCCKFPGTALKLCSDEIVVRKIATFMTSSDPNVKQQALALFTAVARAPETKPLIEKALRGARDVVKSV